LSVRASAILYRTIYPNNNNNNNNYIEFNDSAVEAGLSRINQHKPPGTDGIPALFFKYFSSSLTQGPSHQKCIYRLTVCRSFPISKGKISDSGSYRPITILSPLSKLFEKLVHSRVTSFLLHQLLLSPVHQGFRRTFSTQSATVKFVNDCHLAGDKNQYTVAVFLDYKSYFPSVPHARLLTKLKRYGIRERLLCMVSFLLRESAHDSESWLKFIGTLSRKVRSSTRQCPRPSSFVETRPSYLKNNNIVCT